jgi:hypothetical protein
VSVEEIDWESEMSAAATELMHFENNRAAVSSIDVVAENIFHVVSYKLTTKPPGTSKQLLRSMSQEVLSPMHMEPSHVHTELQRSNDEAREKSMELKRTAREAQLAKVRERRVRGTLGFGDARMEYLERVAEAQVAGPQGAVLLDSFRSLQREVSAQLEQALVVGEDSAHRPGSLFKNALEEDGAEGGPEVNEEEDIVGWQGTPRDSGKGREVKRKKKIDTTSGEEDVGSTVAATNAALLHSVQMQACTSPACGHAL